MKKLKVLSTFNLVAAFLAAFFCFSISHNIQASTLLSDDFTGTTINNSKWSEVDAGGSGGTTGNIQQNGTLTMTGSAAWGQNYLVSASTFDRSLGGLEMEADVTCTASSSIMGIGYGDPGVLTGGGNSYTMYVVNNAIYFSRQAANSNAENYATGVSCTNGVSFHIRITIGTTTGAALYLNNSGTPAATATGGTMNNKGVFLSGHSGAVTLVDNVVVSGQDAATAPDAPTGLTAAPGSTQMGLSWTAPANNGSAITDYVVEYKLSSEPTTWTTFSDGTSTSTSATVTGLTNGLSYDFRVKAINGVGTSSASSTATATPALSVPSAPQSLSATAGNGQVTLSWSVPATNGGAAITDYVVEYKLSSEPTTWTTFSDGTSTSTSATVTGLSNNLAYNFRVKAINSVGTSSASGTASATPDFYALIDDFTGTTIDASKWSESDPAGLGGTTGNVTQNGSLSITGSGSWASQNGLTTVDTYDRTNGDVSMEFSVTRDSCGSGVGPVAAGYGDMNFTVAGTSAYIFLSNTTAWELYYWTNGSNQAGNGSPQQLTGISSCTNGVPTTFRIVVEQGGGVNVYVNGSVSSSATISAGTFTNKPFWFGGLNASGSVLYDSVRIIEPATGPESPTSVNTTPGNGQVGLSWTAGADNGSAITDYVVEYKLSSAVSWSTFSDGTSSSTSTTVTGLSNGYTYNFRISAVNGNGTSNPSTTASAMPISATPTAPIAVSVTITGSAAVGEQLTGTYTFVDVNGDSQATSTYRWLSSDASNGTYAAIAGATSSTYIVNEADVGKYIKFEVTPVSNASPTTGTAVLSSATSQVATIDYLNQILSTGQSLSVGVAASPALSTTQPYSNKMLTGGSGGQGLGTSFTPLVESSVETMSSSIANSLTFNDSGNDLDSVVSLHGVSGYTYSQLKKGTSPFSNGMTQVTNAKNAATLLGRVLRVIGVTSIHGETDNFNGVSGATYQGYLEEWQHDYDTDVKAITGQSSDVPLFIDQMSSFMSSYANDATSEIPIYQLYAAEDNPGKIVLVAPKYFFNYSDRHHLTNQSSRWLGEYHAKVIKKVALQHETWRPLSPDSAIRSGNIIYVRFHVPAGQLQFDTSLVSPRTNYGFEYYDSTSSASISSVEIFSTDTVKVTLSGTPTGSNQRIRYAYTGVPGTDTGAQNAGSAAGNLRDTDPYPSLYGNTLYNWAVHFDEPLTLDSTPPTITSVSSAKANGSYTTGEVIAVTVNFSEPVTSTGNVTVTLETGATDRTCTFTVSNTSSGSCNYTVQAGDTTSDLTVNSVTGTIADAQNNAMVNFSIGTNLAASKDLLIDTSSPVVSSLVATPTTNSVSITWTTDEQASSIIDYGLSSSYGSSTVETDTSPRVTSHTVSVSSLVACTTYHYRVRTKDALLNTTTGTDQTFSTTCTGSATVTGETSSSISNAAGGTITYTSGSTGLGLNIPAGAAGADATFQIKKLDKVTAFVASGTPSGVNSVGDYVFDLKSLTGVGTAVSSFASPIALTLTYQDSDLSGIVESSLVIYHYNGTSWAALTGCTVNTTANTVTCNTSSFSVFSLFGTTQASVAGGGGLPLEAFAPPSAPNGGFIISINNNSITASATKVILSFNAGTDVKKMAISNSADFTNVIQEDYAPSKQWNLCSGLASCSTGKKTIYAKFYTSYGQPSAVITASINYVPSVSKTAPQGSAHPAGTNIKTSDGTVYTVTADGQIRPYTSAGAFLSYGFNSFTNLKVATQGDLALPVGSFIPPRDGSVICSDRGSDKNTCYLITDGKKAGFVSEKVFTSLGYSFKKSQKGDVSFLEKTAHIENGASAHLPGTLIIKSKTVYIVAVDGLIGIPSMKVLKSWGYNISDAITSNPADDSVEQTKILQSKEAGEISVK